MGHPFIPISPYPILTQTLSLTRVSISHSFTPPRAPPAAPPAPPPLPSWEDFGTGTMQLLLDSAGTQVRVLMRSDQSREVVINHLVEPPCALETNVSSDRAWVFRAYAFDAQVRGKESLEGRKRGKMQRRGEIEFILLLRGVRARAVCAHDIMPCFAPYIRITLVFCAI